MDCDAVAVTSDDSTRYNYLRKLAWSLEGTGVEMLVDPGSRRGRRPADAHPPADGMLPCCTSRSPTSVAGAR